ncbi:MAG: KEOPS complex kinase/ATPase Bud32 [Thermoplasmatota archaeon]
MKVEEKEVISKGAEAEIRRGSWNGRELVIKRRLVKGYRHPDLDLELRKQRIRKEARLFREARKAGVPVPIIYDLDESDTTLIIEYIPGERLMHAIEKGSSVDLKRVGKYIGRLHKAGITHGDLTTSNIIYSEGTDSYSFIDFSLGEKDATYESMGVDIHLMREALISVHDDPMEKYDEIISGYQKEFDDAEKVIQKLRDIESRGRYL